MSKPGQSFLSCFMNDMLLIFLAFSSLFQFLSYPFLSYPFLSIPILSILVTRRMISFQIGLFYSSLLHANSNFLLCINCCFLFIHIQSTATNEIRLFTTHDSWCTWNDATEKKHFFRSCVDNIAAISVVSSAYQRVIQYNPGNSNPR